MKSRSVYFSHLDVQNHLKDLRARYTKELGPGCSVMESLGKTPGGRDIWALRIGPRGLDHRQPTLWVDATMHSSELVGTNVVLAQAEHLLERLRKSRQKRDALHWEQNYIFVPRICPDGSEAYFTHQKTNRSNPRDARSLPRTSSYWVRKVLVPKKRRKVSGYPMLDEPSRLGIMRRESVAGHWVEDRECPGLMRRREIQDQGPFYDLFPEGEIANFDGSRIPPANEWDDNEVDLNRNFPHLWKPDQIKLKSGAFSLSEAESRAVSDYVRKFPEIYFWMNYHTFGGVYIRPPSTGGDDAFNILDRTVYETLDRKFEAISGYPAVAGGKEFCYTPGDPVPGTLSDFAYYAQGAYSYVCELWDLPARIGHKERPFIERYNHWDHREWRKIYQYDREENHGILFGHPWMSFEHPQLGGVEISEFPFWAGISNPPASRIQEVVAPQLEVFDLLVELAPRPLLSAELVQDLGSESALLRVTVGNAGFLPTHISHQKTAVHGPGPIAVEISAENGAEIIGPTRAELENLAGYIPLNNGWIHSPAMGSPLMGHRTVEFSVALRKKSRVRVRAIFPFAGQDELVIEVEPGERR